jgi:hypothetical protein
MKIMERCLAVWIEDLYQQHIPISPALIQEKAISLHEAVKEELGDEEAAEMKPFGAQESGFIAFRSSIASKM